MTITSLYAIAPIFGRDAEWVKAIELFAQTLGGMHPWFALPTQNEPDDDYEGIVEASSIILAEALRSGVDPQTAYL